MLDYILSQEFYHPHALERQPKISWKTKINKALFMMDSPAFWSVPLEALHTWTLLGFSLRIHWKSHSVFGTIRKGVKTSWATAADVAVLIWASISKYYLFFSIFFLFWGRILLCNHQLVPNWWSSCLSVSKAGISGMPPLPARIKTLYPWPVFIAQFWTCHSHFLQLVNPLFILYLALTLCSYIHCIPYVTEEYMRRCFFSKNPS